MGLELGSKELLSQPMTQGLGDLPGEGNQKPKEGRESLGQLVIREQIV
jgi:hypothetical protein